MLSILIVNWNTRDLLRACLSSIRQNVLMPHEIIVVDNDSQDNSAAMIEEEFPEALLIANNFNAGFAGGNNQAYQKARGEWIWLLNPDTEVLPGAAEKLIEFLNADARRGAAASALIDARHGHIQRSCRTFPTPAALWAQGSGLARKYPRSRRFGFYKMGGWNMKSAREVDQPMASSFLIKRAAIESIGELFDEQFPIFFNDVDLCWRLKKADWQIWYLPEAKVVHWGGAGTSQVRPQMIEESHRSLRRFYEKHYKKEIAPPLYRATLGLAEVTGWLRVKRAKIKHKSTKAQRD
jgi:GT2 family glycosyltransferase